jgi:formylmethanofuran dehydrogenase subunit D
MKKNNKKKKKTTETCIDCNMPTDDYYKVPTNRGDIVKCANCYELWVLRSARGTTLALTMQNIDE